MKTACWHAFVAAFDIETMTSAVRVSPAGTIIEPGYLATVSSAAGHPGLPLVTVVVIDVTLNANRIALTTVSGSDLWIPGYSPATPPWMANEVAFARCAAGADGLEVDEAGAPPRSRGGRRFH